MDVVGLRGGRCVAGRGAVRMARGPGHRTMESVRGRHGCGFWKFAHW